MKTTYEDDVEIADVPVSAALKAVRPNESEDDEEAIDWSEVERLVFERDWGPILALPPRRNEHPSLPAQWEDGVNVSQFYTHDFTRLHGEFDRYRYAMEWARQERLHALFTLEAILERIPDRAKYRVLRLIKEGVLAVELIRDPDMKAAALWYRRVLAASEKIGRIAEARRRHARGPGASP